MQNLGTVMVADYTNHMGGLPVRNFSEGQSVDSNVKKLKMGGLTRSPVFWERITPTGCFCSVDKSNY